MLIRTLTAISVAALCSIALAAGNHDHSPKHGGMVVEVRDFDIELIASSAKLTVFVRDHGKPVDLTKASGKVSLLNGTQKQDIELKPSKENLEATGTFDWTSGSKAVVQIKLGSQSLTARFAAK